MISVNSLDHDTSPLHFKRISHEAMDKIWPLLQQEKGKTTDFSYGGILMWVDLFNYEYDIYEETLFIKGVVENDMSKPAFSLPVGKLTLNKSICILKEYCNAINAKLEFSAVPEHAVYEMSEAGADLIEELKDWGDYLYDAATLVSLKGKKMSKKRNHINQFISHYPCWHTEELSQQNAHFASEIIDKMDIDGDTSPMAISERRLSKKMIELLTEGDPVLEGMILFVDDIACAFTIGDVKDDTLFIHIEKALRKFNGSYEMINRLFAKAMTEKYPGIRFINREDDAGEPGLRMAKESYHPLRILKKYNITFP